MNPSVNACLSIPSMAGRGLIIRHTFSRGCIAISWTSRIHTTMAHQGLWGDFSLNSQRIHGESAEVKEDIGFKAFAVAVAAGLLYE